MSAPRTSPRSRSTGSHRVLLRARRPFHSGLPPLRMEEGRQGRPCRDAAKLEDLADRGGVGLTPHAVAVDRPLAAVAKVNKTINKMGSTGDLKAFNRAFTEGGGFGRRSFLRLPFNFVHGQNGGEYGWLTNDLEHARNCLVVQSLASSRRTRRWQWSPALRAISRSARSRIGIKVPRRPS
jgi:hypothetical protein